MAQREVSIRFLSRGTTLPSTKDRERQRAVDALPDPAGRSPELDQIATAAASLCGVATGLVTVIDGDAMLTPGQFNSKLRDVARAESVCNLAIQQPEEAFCVPDLHAEARFARLGVAKGPDAIRFYAGAPLMSDDGQVLGMVCAVDADPHAPINDEQRRALWRLARLAVPKLMAMPPRGRPAA